jgi:hypothetical protein
MEKQPLDNKTRAIVGVSICAAVGIGFATVGWGAVLGLFALAYIFEN